MANVTSLLTSLCENFKNSASISSPGTLPSQTVTNPRQQINAITTRSGKTLEGPSTPLIPTPIVSNPSKEPEQNPETSTEKVQNPNLAKAATCPTPGKKFHVHGNSKQKLRKQLYIGLKDALVEMPKFNKWLSSLLRNKEKLEEIAITTVNAECSAIIMNRVPEKLEDPGKFLIPCALQELDRTRRPFLRTAKALIDLYEEKLTLRVGKDELCTMPIKSEKNKEKNFVHAILLRFSKISVSGSTTTHSNDPSPSSSPVKTSDNFEKFADDILSGFVYTDECFAPEDNNDEIDNFLAMEVSSNLEEGYFDSEGDIAFLDNLLSDDDSHNLASKVTSDHEPEQNESSITFSPRSDPLHHEFAGEPLTLPARNDREFEEYLSLMTVLYEISTSQGNIHQNSVIESLPISPIPVEDSEPTQEEIDILLIPDNLIPPGVEDADSEDEVNESPNLDHQDDPSIPRPPPEPPDIKKCFKLEAGILIIKEFKGDSKSHDFMTGILPTLPTLVSNLIFISSFISFENEDTIFDPGIVTFLEPVAFSKKVSRSKLGVSIGIGWLLRLQGFLELRVGISWKQSNGLSKIVSLLQSIGSEPKRGFHALVHIGKRPECDDESVALANLIANLKLNVDENKKIQKQLKKANASLTQELKEWQNANATLEENYKPWGVDSIRIVFRLHSKQTEFEGTEAL
ncbi:hypothetical protein Tco_0892464 [Tanacetum coccineum]|uniref:Reverse transcriptase domain-containing protein n=1 Tax=Tanacetum coccineum TaxID=301880 RepID=A0ABQ5C8Y5_9ASTR